MKLMLEKMHNKTLYLDNQNLSKMITKASTIIPSNRKTNKIVTTDITAHSIFTTMWITLQGGHSPVMIKFPDFSQTF